MRNTTPFALRRPLPPTAWLPLLLFVATFLVSPALARSPYLHHRPSRPRPSETEEKFTVLGDHGDATLREALAAAMRAEKTALRGYLVRVREPDGEELAAIYLVSFRREEEQLGRLGHLYAQATGDARVWLAFAQPDSVNRQIHRCTPFYRAEIKPVPPDPRHQTRHYILGVITMAGVVFLLWQLIRRLLV